MANVYGGFVLSKRIKEGMLVGWTFREEESPEMKLNGWTLYSVADDEDYISDPSNFEIVGAETIQKYAPLLLDIFDAPVGTDLEWRYSKKLFKIKFEGLYDLQRNCDTTVEKILSVKN